MVETHIQNSENSDLSVASSSNNRIGGIIGYLGMENFWNSCSYDEKQNLVRYYRDGIADQYSGSPIEGTIESSSETRFHYLSCLLGYAGTEKNFEFVDKLVSYAKGLDVGDKEVLDAHYFWQEASECYFRQRFSREDALNQTISVCMIDINLFPKYKKPLTAPSGCLPRITTFFRLVTIYEKEENYQEALKICKLAIQYGLDENTIDKYQERLLRLEKLID